MNAFKILNAEGEAITMAALDKEAAKFWGKEVDPKHYANPFPKEEGDSFSAICDNALNDAHNWFDIIGWNIANQGDYTTGWQNVAHTMVTEGLGKCLVSLHKDKPVRLAEFVGDNDIHLEESYETRLYATLNYYKPFIDLINHWMAKGYTPVKVEE